MFVVRNTFTARPGMATKLAKFFKDTMKDMPGPKPRILTDVVSDYNTVIMEFEFKDLDEFQKQMKDYTENPDLRKRMGDYTEMWMTGKREVFRTID